MKTTYLVLKQVNGVEQLTAVSQAEWDAIMKENRGRPMEQRRVFIKDCFADGDELDCMYIETTASAFRKWNNADKESRKKQKAASRYLFKSIDNEGYGTGHDSVHKAIPADFNLEDLVTDQILMEELRTALRSWKPWAEGMLRFYLAGEKRTCNKVLGEKDRLTDRAIRKRKRAFEKFVLDFLQE